MTPEGRAFRELVDQLPQPIFETDARGMITFTNRCALDLFGYDEGDLQRGVQALDLIAKSDRERAAGNIARSMAGEKLGPNEYRLEKKDGTSFPCLIHSQVIVERGTHVGLRGVAVDLTALREAEGERRRSVQAYQTVIENTGTAILILEEDMTVTFASREMERLTGRRREEIEGKPFPLDRIMPEYRDMVGDFHGKRRESPEGVPPSYEIGFLDSEDRERYVLLTVSLIPGTGRSVVSMVDITERVRSEQSLRESEGKFRDLAENSPNMIFINQGGRIVYANHLCSDILGYSREEFYAPEFDFRVLIAPDSMEFVGRLYAAHLRGEEAEAYEYGLLTRDGRRIDAINNARLINYHGEPAILGIVTDITMRRKSEQKLEEAYGELEAQNRELKKLDEMKDVLIRAVSHELKTPVAKHSMQLEILKPIAASHGLSSEEQRALEVMEESIRRQESVIRNLLDLSRLEGGERDFARAEVELGGLLRDVVEDYGYAAEAHGIEIELGTMSLTIMSDADMLWHLFSNLVNNAIKFRCREGKCRIAIDAAERNGHAVICVSDNGIGMEKEHVEQAFSRFFQASAAYEGSGVGLTICRMIAEELGGRIELESTGPGAGTAVTVTLPRT